MSAREVKSEDPATYGTTTEPERTSPVGSDLLDSNDSSSPRSIIADVTTGEVQDVFSKDKFRILKNYVSQGEIIFKLIGMASGGVLIVRGFLGFLGNIFALYLFGAVVDVIFLVVGGICVFYEYDERKVPIEINTYLHNEFHIFSTPFGRSATLASAGLLMLQQPLGIGTLLGLFICGGSSYVFYNMWRAEDALNKMKSHVADEKTLRILFDKCDVDKNGELFLKLYY